MFRWTESGQFFDFAQATLEACRLDVANTELVYDTPSERDVAGSDPGGGGLRSALAAVRIHSKELIGKMCRYTSGEAVRQRRSRKDLTRGINSASQAFVLLRRE